MCLGFTNVRPLRGQVGAWRFFYKRWAAPRPSLGFEELGLGMSDDAAVGKRCFHDLRINN